MGGTKRGAKERDLKSIHLMWRWWWSRGSIHSAPRASRAVWDWHRVEDNELRHWAKPRQLYCLRELRWCLCTVLHSPAGCPGSLNRSTLCDVDDPRDCAPKVPLSFKEKLSQHEPRTLRDVKLEDLLPWADDQEEVVLPPPWLQSKASFTCVLIRAPQYLGHGMITCSSALCFLNVSLLFLILQMITAGWS